MQPCTPSAAAPTGSTAHASHRRCRSLAPATTTCLFVLLQRRRPLPCCFTCPHIRYMQVMPAVELHSGGERALGSRPLVNVHLYAVLLQDVQWDQLWPVKRESTPRDAFLNLTTCLRVCGFKQLSGPLCDSGLSGSDHL